jgi:hypothetical protein
VAKYVSTVLGGVVDRDGHYEVRYYEDGYEGDRYEEDGREENWHQGYVIKERLELMRTHLHIGC